MNGKNDQWKLANPSSDANDIERANITERGGGWGKRPKKKKKEIVAVFEFHL